MQYRYKCQHLWLEHFPIEDHSEILIFLFFFIHQIQLSWCDIWSLKTYTCNVSASCEMTLLTTPMVSVGKSAWFTVQYNIWTSFGMFNLWGFDFITSWWHFNIQFVFWFEYLAIAWCALTNVSSSIIALSICNDQLNSLLLKMQKKKKSIHSKLYWNMFHFIQIKVFLTWKLLGSLWCPSLFHVTELSGDDDLQSTTIESPGCNNERAGSNFTYGAEGTNDDWDAVFFLWSIIQRKISRKLIVKNIVKSVSGFSSQSLRLRNYRQLCIRSKIQA